VDNMHCTEQQLSCQAAAVSRLAGQADTRSPNLNRGAPYVAELTAGHIISVAMYYVNAGTWSLMY